MVKKRKLFQKILSGSKNVRFAEFTSVLESFGFVLERIRGSHHIYSHSEVPQAISVQSDSNGQAKPYQMKQFAKLIEKYDLHMIGNAGDQDEMEKDQ
jgi:predicted RNA binding protein YcfA (HicA-like mRNA interferase family)